MSKIAISGASSGTATFTIESPATSTNRTLTLPDNTGTMMLTNTAVAKSQLPAGSVLQVVQSIANTQQATTSQTYVDVTGLTATITPTSASSKILVFVTPNFYVSTDGNGYPQYFLQLLRTSTAIFTKRNYLYADRAANSYFELAGDGNMAYLDSPNTTSATTYKVQTKVTYGSGTVTIVYQMISDCSSTITLMEIAA
jgi:hypothetical protein